MKILSGLIIVCTLFSSGFIPDIFGHGLGGEVLPPVTINDKEATLSIAISPSIYDPKNPETNISLKLFNSDTSAIIEHVTFELEFKKMVNNFSKIFFMMNLVI